MSEFETNIRVRFPLKERVSSFENKVSDNNECKIKDTSGEVKPIQHRKQSLQDFDAESTFIVPKDMQQIFNMAESFYLEGLDSKAYECYLQYIGSGSYDPHNLFVAYKNIGNIKIRSGDLDGAEEYYHKAFTLNPDSDTLLVNLGTLEIQKRNLERALDRYRMAVDVNPNNSRGWIGLALAHREYGDMDLAWGNLQRALDIDPSDDTALELVVQWGIKDSRFDLTIDRLKKYLEINPNNTHMRNTLTQVYIIGGRLNIAKTFIEESLCLEPNNEDFLKIQAHLNSICKEMST